MSAAGIGENGHPWCSIIRLSLMFSIAVLVKVVRPDAAASAQQINDGCSKQGGDIPTHAYTMTIPAATFRDGRVGRGTRPTESERGLDGTGGQISESCSATGAVRQHKGAKSTLIATRPGW